MGTPVTEVPAKDTGKPTTDKVRAATEASNILRDALETFREDLESSDATALNPNALRTTL
ncbi:hypothetical protein A6M27_02760 [Acidithiobacillus thiooxidans]|uniref:Uncharacterized protein n=1 Tax=Acidithiobacillus thiooxidans TaxID=930 RepID=A0A1C2JM21_ACITH|nr:hypothetical protein A6O24_14230 [Acidithiobacillus thiooxidans]OCX76259.1 hypothetical protein A6P07_02890 [Acidithiobacillus thiooxidans]OCX78489.1 hypothetical protein A6O26_18070 [Acidithiobacillus thiooxidans]OCX89270.1 hypothetical protein A6M27_02760 [Acidithiobacillus thiooxidans]OFC49119.1 hypothetical protein BAE47_06075 [Acidithiobacillus thiooxidans]